MDSQNFDKIKAIYNDLTSGPRQLGLKDLIVLHRKQPQKSHSRRIFLADMLQATISELQSQDLKIKQVAASKMLFLLNEHQEGLDQQAFPLIELLG